MAAPPVKTSAPWCVLADLPAKATDGRWELDVTSGGEMADWIQVASDVLFNLTRRRWPGATTATIRPMPVGDTIGVDGVSEIVLPNLPVVSISQVLIDGAVVASSLYRVDDYRRLVYIPTAGVSRSAWPASQDLDAPTTATGTLRSPTSTGLPRRRAVSGRVPSWLPNCGSVHHRSLPVKPACRAGCRRYPGRACRRRCWIRCRCSRTARPVFRLWICGSCR